MPASVPPAPSLPGVAQTFPSATVFNVSEELTVARPLYETVATFEIVPAAVGTTVMVTGAEVAPAASVPRLHVTGPVPEPPVCETNAAPAGMASGIVTVLTDAEVEFVAGSV